MKHRAFLALASICLLLGCNGPDTIQHTTYFDLAKLIKDQIKVLSAAKVSLYKSGVLNGKTTNNTLDTINWAHELEPFLRADINKPSWKGAYKVDSTEQSIQYTTTKADLPVKSLLIAFNQAHQPEKIMAVYKRSTALKDDEIRFGLEFQTHQKLPRLVAYTIEGSDDVVLQQPNSFLVRGDLKWAE